MKPDVTPETDHDVIDRILAAEQEMVPSSGFLAATMERVRAEAAAPAPIPFPWPRVLPGIVLAVAVFGWCGFELARAGLANVREISFEQLHVTAIAGRALEPAAWAALALIASMLSWLFARRLAGRSGLL
jgi:hypothetical protein